MQPQAAKLNFVLWGVGHTNAHILRMWQMQPIPQARLICISQFPVATYSGMLPAVLAGQHPREAMEIDLVRLAAAHQALLIIGEPTGVDRDRRQILFADRCPVPYDVLSIGIGSQPSFEGVRVDDPAPLVAIKPMQTFLDRLILRLDEVRRRSQVCRILIVGGGAGSIEVAACLRAAAAGRNTHPDAPLLRALQQFDPIELTLCTGSQEIGSGLQPRTVRKIVSSLRELEIAVKKGTRVAAVTNSGCLTSEGKLLAADLVIWATNARAPQILSQLQLPVDSRGFLLTHSTLQTQSDPAVFAVGDSGTLIESPTDKAGVFAVRQGPVLWQNFQRWAARQTLVPFYPQRRFLKLLNLGNGQAIVEYGGWSARGRLWWQLKDRIDSRFMRMYQVGATMMADAHREGADPVRCLGCGGKVGAGMLAEALLDLPRIPSPHVLLGLDPPDDAAIVKVGQSTATITTDFFAAPLPDSFLSGRIAALNSLSDLYVMGARPTVAFANVQLLEGHPRGQSRELRALMAGASVEFQKAQVALAGGHTLVGPQMTIGFTILGEQESPPLTKAGLQPGVRLILTKPIGSGALLAALMQAQLKGRDYLALRDHLLIGNEIALELAKKFSLRAMTDITGFGLAGHLTELLVASHCSARIRLEAIPLLPGFQQLTDEGIRSTLAPENEAFVQRIRIEAARDAERSAPSLYDPQTCGGILFGIAPQEVAPALAFLTQRGFPQAADIGEVLASSNGESTLLIER